METRTVSKAFKAISIVTLLISSVLLCIAVSQILQGHHTFFDAAQVVYNHEDVAAIDQVRTISGLELVGFLAGMVVMFIAGLFGVLFAKNPKKALLGTSCAVVAIVAWIATFIVEDFMLAPILRTYDIYSDSSLPLVAPIVVLLVVYIVLALVNRRAWQQDNTKLSQ